MITQSESFERNRLNLVLVELEECQRYCKNLEKYCQELEVLLRQDIHFEVEDDCVIEAMPEPLKASARDYFLFLRVSIKAVPDYILAYLSHLYFGKYLKTIHLSIIQFIF